MSSTHEFSDETFDDFLDSLPEVTPPPALKDRVFAQLDGAGSDGAGCDGAGSDGAGSDGAEIIELPRRRWRAFVAVPVAAAVLVAGFALWTGGPGASGPDSGERVVAESAGEKSMHAIMAAEDLMTANANASGATLDIVSSAEMDKSGAMVDGQPRLDAGMGAQVWAVSADGTVTSAGVIGQDPHDGVWMPFEGEAVKVMVTEEPMAGSAEPTGRTLAEVRLS